jgi:hypothetical protein
MDRMSTTPQCWKCGYELSGLQVNDLCPECGTPVWSQRPPEQASAEAHRSLVWGLCSLILFFICIGPLAGFVAIPALVYASKAKREVRAGLLRASQASEARTGAILGWVTVGLSVGLTVVYGLIILVAAL